MIPPRLRAPALWVPVTGPAQVLLPYDESAGGGRANRDWVKDVCGPRTRVNLGPNGRWLVAKSHAYELLEALCERFPPGSVMVVTDAAQQQKCGPACQEAKPENAFMCVCACGGENHGGVASTWTLRDTFAIQTTVIRRVFFA